ncbi:HNH endonuclease (plasmid) [Leptospira noguchii]|nr:RHS repeat-associated core domain-containing protein [Leptospira noguchii]UOG36242.1 HNH endonuclease [Leptospira noguchii]UOG47205.1 HNH endonuclease [Leptospira noguchii]
MVLRVTLCIAFLSFNLLTGAESLVSEKLERSSNVEYNKTLKHKTTFLRKPPYLLIPNHSPLETYDESGFRIRRSALEPKNNVFSNVEILYPSKFFGLEFIESENVITSVNNVYLNGVRIAALNEAGALAYYLTDQVDSVSTVLDDEGNTLSQMQYLPYGETFVQRGDLNFSPKYNSQELDRESGFYFFNARYYDPGIARFTSADTIIDGEFDTQGWNRFSYVKGNPITFKDPTGHEVPLIGYGSPRDGLLPGSRNTNDPRYQSEIANKYDLKDKGKIEAAAKEYQAGSQKGFNQGYSRTSGWASPTQGHNAKSDGQALEKSDLSGKSKAYKDGYKDSVGVGRAYGILGGLGTGIAEAAGLATAGGVGKEKGGGPKLGSSGGEGAGKAFSNKVKAQARAESENTCVFCKKETTDNLGPTKSEIDHAIPKVRGGNNTIENAQNTCRTCNRQKGASTTEEFLGKIRK